MLDWLQSKAFRRDVRRITWPIAFGLGAGPGNFALGFLAGVLGFKLWDKGKQFYDYVERRDAAANEPRQTR